jgi:hypothetical protein
MAGPEMDDEEKQRAAFYQQHKKPLASLSKK